MPEPPASSEPVVYQLGVVLRSVSPLTWRRLLVRSDSTIADLHATFQRVLGWSDEHLNRFVIHGREYGVSHAASASATIPDGYAWPTLAYASVNASCTNTTSLTAGSTTCESSRSCHSLRDGATRSALVGDEQCHPRTAAGRGLAVELDVQFPRLSDPDGQVAGPDKVDLPALIITDRFGEVWVAWLTAPSMRFHT